MTLDEKLASLRIKLGDEEVSDETLIDVLEDSKYLILNRIYELTEIPEGIDVPSRYERVQLKIAVELFNKRGAEGETSHSENGISRTYESASVSPSLLREVKPKIASVIRANTNQE